MQEDSHPQGRSKAQATPTPQFLTFIGRISTKYSTASVPQHCCPAGGGQSLLEVDMGTQMLHHPLEIRAWGPTKPVRAPLQ